jgi:hypothetical protein
VAFIHEEDGVSSDGNAIKEYHSKLVKADIHGKDQVSELLNLFDYLFTNYLVHFLPI